MKFAHLITTLASGFILSASASAAVLDDVLARNTTLPDYAALHRQVNDTTRPMLWLFLGDSITHGCLHTHGARSYPEHWMEICKWETMPTRGVRRTNDLVINAGVSSETASGFLSHTEWRLAPFAANVVFINFGINDADHIKDPDKFHRDLTTIVQMVRAKNAIPVLQTPSLTLAAKPFRPAYAQLIRRVAQEQNTLLVDHTAVWEELAGSPGASSAATPQSIRAPRHLMNNDLHPNGNGHLLMAKTIARSLNLVPANSPTMKRGK